MKPSRRRIAAAALLVVVCGCLAYSNSFTNLFVGLDGKQSIRDNPHIRTLWPLSEAFSLPLWRASIHVHETPAVALRPIFSLSLALTHHFFGPDPTAHHAINLSIHLLAALVLLGIVRRTLETPGLAGRTVSSPLGLALVVTLVWMLHPLQTESVTYIVQRAEALMALFLFLALYAAIRARESKHALAWQVLAVFSCAIGIGAKQSACLAPLLVFLHDFTFAPPQGKRWARPFFYGALTLPFAFVPLAAGSMPSRYFGWQTVFDFAIKQPPVILHYLRLTIWPDDLYVYVNTTLFDVPSVSVVVLPTLILVLLVLASFYALTRAHWLGFVGAWFFCTLAPTSTIIPIPDSIQEHRMYVPLAALAVLAVIAGDAGLARTAAGRRRWLRVAIAAVVVAGLGWRTYVRNWDYHREFSMIHPHDLHTNYTILADHFLSEDSILQFEAASARQRLRQPTGDAREVPFDHFVVALAHQRQGELDAAVAAFERAIAFDPEFAYAHKELGVVLRDKGDLAKAAEHLERAIAIDPRQVYAYKTLALVRADLGDTAAAEDLLERSLRIDPGFGEGYLELGVLQAQHGDTESASANFVRAIAVQPDLYEAHYERALLLDEAGREDEALTQLHAALRLEPDFVEALVRMGAILREREDWEGALASLRRATQLQPDAADAHLELGLLWQARDDAAAALAAFEEALRLDPGWAAATEGAAAARARLAAERPTTR